MGKYVSLVVPSIGLLFSGKANSTDLSQPEKKSPTATRATAPYLLDSNAFANKLAVAKEEDAKQAVLERRWEAVSRAVAFCDVAGHGPSFHQSSTYWHNGFTGGEKNEQKASLTEPVEIEKGAVIVRGDCRADITVKGSAFIHVYGDLDAKIMTVGDAHSEIVIGGNIKQGAMIDGAKITEIFVGGNVDGDIECQGSSFITWINSDLNGAIVTGRPGSSVHVMGDFNGSMKPRETASPSGATLDVRGFMSEEKIRAVARENYITFQASIGFSDMPAGLYPKAKRYERSQATWVVHTQLY